jgi:hypothetical protein
MNAAQRMAKRVREQVTASHGKLPDAQADDAVVQEPPVLAVQRQQEDAPLLQGQREAPRVQEHWTLVKLKELAADVVRQSRGTLTKAQAWNTVLDSEQGREIYQAYRRHRIEMLRRR